MFRDTSEVRQQIAKQGVEVFADVCMGVTDDGGVEVGGRPEKFVAHPNLLTDGVNNFFCGIFIGVPNIGLLLTDVGKLGCIGESCERNYPTRKEGVSDIPPGGVS